MRLRSSFIVLALTLLAAACGGSNSGGSNLTLDTGPAPWPNPDNVAERIDAAGLPSSSTESLTVHYHSHVDIFVDGQPEPVASSIGREDQSLFSPLHTHSTSGLIHIEAPEEQDFTVAMLFTEWGVRLTSDCIGGFSMLSRLSLIAWASRISTMCRHSSCSTSTRNSLPLAS